MEMEYIISHYIWTKALLGEEKKKKKRFENEGISTMFIGMSKECSRRT